MKKLVVITVIVLFIGTSVLPSINGNLNKMTGTINPICFDDNLIGCWHFDEGSGNVTFDSSGHNNNGTIYGASWVGGISGKALWFDGNDDYVRVFNTSDFEFINQSFTFSTWVKIYDNTNNNRWFISLGDTDGPPVINLGKCRSGYNDGKIVLSMINNEYEQTTCSSIDNGDALSKNQWMHVAGVANYESNLIALYIDGNFQESQSIVGLNLSKAQDLRLIFGNYTRTNPSYDHHHYGALDEVYIYNRALTDEEILDYYEEFYPVEAVYVDDDFNESTPGWGYDHFDSIQDGVDAVAEDGTVYVYNGTYNENVIIDKTIKLKGEDENTTIIDGGGTDDVIHINADNVEISNFSITNCGIYGWQNDYDAGIDVRSNKNIFFNNRIYSNYLHGFYIRSSSNNTIFSNNISNSHVGMQIVHSCNNNIITGNRISNIGGSGLRFYESSQNTINSNTITSANCSIILEENSNNNFIHSNLFAFNNVSAIKAISSSTANLIYHNNFENNTVNAVDECGNIWDNGYPSGGNYWSDYFYDDNFSGPAQDVLGRDGIGDVPYEIPCEHGTDYYPLMKPGGWIHYPPYILDKPSGETIILPGFSYTYNISAIDPDNDSIWFLWDWGDGTFSDWIGPYDSGEVVSSTHIYPQGTYEIRVKVKDSRNPETDWSEPLIVNVIYPDLETVLLFGFIENRTQSTNYYSFNAVKLLWIGFNPLLPEIYSSNELFIVSDIFFGRLRQSFIIGFFKAMLMT